MIEALLDRFAVSPRVAAAARAAYARTAGIVRPHRAEVGAAVLRAFYDEGVAESDLAGSFGYGYDDQARARYESLLARLFGAERALARFSFVSGTHAIVAALGAFLERGSRLVVATGRPYDTLRNALADAPDSFVARGVVYDEVPLDVRGEADVAALAARCARGVDVVFIQRSRGYAPRASLSAARCGELAAAVKREAPEALVLVDNCYGELVEATEPTHHGVDAVMGSLIKNLGGGLAPGGGYVVGRAAAIERIASRHYAPGLGAAVGPTFGFGRALLQGLFVAPGVVDECLAGLDFAAALFEELGFEVNPRPGEPRFDIVQALRLGSPEAMLAFASGLQRAMPLNARFAPEPGSVPGYAEPVLMSAGSFVSGATIELSADGPLRAPYEVYLQGGLLRGHTFLGSLLAAESVDGESNRPSAREGKRVQMGDSG
jgi:cystathionine beta-lyase family protein involved in aluminum resistance